MPSPILARADALMHRKRQAETEFDDVPTLTDAIDDEDDIPVLVDEASSTIEESTLPSALPLPDDDYAIVAQPPVLHSHETAASQQETTPTRAPINADLHEQLACELARRVEQRLATELPRIIESTLRDFLAEQAMIAAAPHRD